VLIQICGGGTDTLTVYEAYIACKKLNGLKWIETMQQKRTEAEKPVLETVLSKIPKQKLSRKLAGYA
jgi:hypothetical protein